MRLAVAALVLSTGMGPAGSPVADDQSFVVVVAANNPVSSMKREELARLFLKKTSRWSDGREVLPVDQSVGSPVRRTFTHSVLSVEGLGQISAVQNFWLQQVYSGRSAPPPVKPTDSDVLAYVGANPGAIGYVSSPPPAGTAKVLSIEDGDRK
jgi:ABC-type phosphate transport system substrate-binding protein